MRLRPPYLVLAAVLQAGLLAVLATGSEAPTIRPEQAPVFEGQGDVRVVGVVMGVQSTADSTRITLAGAGMQLDARVDGAVHVPKGAWVEALGRIVRLGGNLALLVSGNASVATVAPPGITRPAWSDLAAHPEAWQGKPILIEGTVRSGELRDLDGHHVTLGAGPWPAKGAVEAKAVLGYEPGCLCYSLLASEVTLVTASGTAWTA